MGSFALGECSERTREKATEREREREHILRAGYVLSLCQDSWRERKMCIYRENSFYLTAKMCICRKNSFYLTPHPLATST
jgi:hypothetical protein